MSKSFIEQINRPMTMSMFARKEDMLTAAMEDRAFAADLLNEMLLVLKFVRECCLAGDDHGISVSEDVVIDSDLFDRICAAINKAEGRP